MKSLFIKQDINKSEASVVDGTLVLSLPNALTPVVWRWNLGDVKASALEVREDDDRHKLILKTPRGDVQEVAPFADKDSALKALLVVSQALQGAKGQMQAGNAQPQENTAPVKPSGEASKILTGFLAVLVIVGLLFWLSTLMPKRLDTSTNGANTIGAREAQTGVPMSAEDFINGN